MEVITGNIYDIQAFSLQDGPGIRTTVFLKGCPLHCPWCHSPESQRFESELGWMEMKCVGIDACGLCLKACTRGALKAGERFYSELKQEEMQMPVIDRSLCDNCGECAFRCPAQALYMCGTSYTVEQVLEKALKDKKFYDKSGGGITVSGGEALSQIAFTRELLKRLKECGIHTALDTTGYATWEQIASVLPYTDLFLYDLKCMDDEMHQAVMGVSNVPILENIKKIAANGGKIQVRIPLIPQFNDSDENLRAAAQLCKELGDAVTMVQLLPYHTYGTVKYSRIKWEQPVFEAVPLCDERVEEIRQMFQDMGLNTTVH